LSRAEIRRNDSASPGKSTHLRRKRWLPGDV
jgi:hypothetical protein